MPDQVYTLSLNSKGILYDGKDDGSVALDIVNGTAKSAVFSGYALRFSLYGVSFRRKMYEPGHIQAEILIETDVKDEEGCKPPSVEIITKMLHQRPVNMKIGSDVFAKNYYIHEISPQYVKASKKGSWEEEGPDGNTILIYYYTYSIYTMLDIFSLDKMFTLQKFSRAYLGKRLFADIIANQIKEMYPTFTYLKDGKDVSEQTYLSLSSKTRRKLHHIVYTLTEDDPSDKSENPKGLDKLEEMICPYLVQYNESPYDFYRRVANRFGEVLYFEDGMLCYGLLDSSPVPVNNAASIIFQHVSAPARTILVSSRDSVKEWKDGKVSGPADGAYMADPVKKRSDGFPEDAFAVLDEKKKDAGEFEYFYHPEYGEDEQYELLYKDKHSKFDEGTVIWWNGDGLDAFFPVLSDILNATSLLGLLTTFVTKMTMQGIRAGVVSAKRKKKWDETFNNSKLRKADDYAVMFAHIDKMAEHWFTFNYYWDIQCEAQKQLRKMVCIDMGTGTYYALKLGDRITLPNSDETYVVVQIDMCSSTAWNKSYFRNQGDTMLTPGTQAQRIYAIPLSDKDGKFYPSLLSPHPFPHSGPQTAFVTHNSDPLSQGRVRVSFTWQPSFCAQQDIIVNYEDIIKKAPSAIKEAQDELSEYADKKTEEEAKGIWEDFEFKVWKTYSQKSSASKDKYDKAAGKFESEKTKYSDAQEKLPTARKTLEEYQASTPWIRVATPMATPGGGMYFKPEVGDEVIVDFENGNMERPFVVGTVYSKNVPQPYQGDRVIVSKNGHTIRLSDPNNGTLLGAGLYPGLQYLTSLGVVGNGLPKVEEQPWKCLGGIELTDAWGLYKIKMSSHERNITISSPFGDVKMNALTGIKISAPNGNIKIVGKNIDIVAGNRVSISSGKNIKDGGYLEGFTSKEGLLKSAGTLLGREITAVTGMDKWLDFSILRSLLEIVLRPVDGTLQLKSYRYLLMEAGGGDAYIKPSNYKKDKLTSRSLALTESQILQELFIQYGELLDEYVATYIRLYNDAVAKITAFTPQEIVVNGAGPAPNPVWITAPADRNTLATDLFMQPDENTARDLGGQLTFNAAINPPLPDASKEIIKNKCAAAYRSISALKEYSQRLGNVFSGKDPLYFKNRSKYKIFGSLIGSFIPNPASGLAGTVQADLTANITTTMPNALNNDIQNLRNAVYNQNLAPNYYDNVLRALKRKTAYTIIDSFIRNNPFSTFQLSLANPAPGGITPYDSDANWTAFLNDIRLTKIESNAFLSALKDTTVGTILGDNPYNMEKNIWSWEGNIWDEAATGEILFTNNCAKTYRFTKSGNSQMESYASPDNGKDLAAFLGILKTTITF